MTKNVADSTNGMWSRPGELGTVSVAKDPLDYGDQKDVMARESASVTFVLVHGGGHGALCWDLLIPELEKLGFGALAVDLPIEDTLAGPTQYAEVVQDAILAADLEGPLVAVGHSLGGHVIPILPTLMQVGGLIYLCAAIPDWLAPSALSAPERHTNALQKTWLASPDDLLSETPENARELYYHDCEPSIQDWAISRLRPQSIRWRQPGSPLSQPPIGGAASTPSAYIMATEDRALNPDWCRFVATVRLKCPLYEIAGSHSPFLSRAPELARLMGAASRDLMTR